MKKKTFELPLHIFLANKSNLNENNTRRFYFSHTQTSITGTATADSAAVTASSGLKFEQTKNKAVNQKQENGKIAVGADSFRRNHLFESGLEFSALVFALSV